MSWGGVAYLGLAFIGLTVSLTLVVDTLPSLAPKKRHRRGGHWRMDTPRLPYERLQLLIGVTSSCFFEWLLFRLMT